MSAPDRRQFLGTLAAAAAFPLLGVTRAPVPAGTGVAPRALRIRTITAGVALTRLDDLRRIESAIATLDRAKRSFEAEGYEVQTIRLATPPILADADARAREAAVPRLQALDELVSARGARISIGPVLAADRDDAELPAWVAELVRSTKMLNLTVAVASPDSGPYPLAAAVAARTTLAIARATPGGVGNFRFAAVANVPPGTPFFPAAYHAGPDALAVGLESASLVEEALRERGDAASATRRLRERLDQALAPIELSAAAFARQAGKAYLGIDPSPAPGKDRSIGAAIEAFTAVPFGSASTLDACAAVTGALKTLRVRTCGYAGLMLPVLEDPVLAARATEGRYGVRDLLLYSSVCGTGLDVVPLPGDTPEDVMARVILDVAALSSRLRKPLSARLFPIPGKGAGETARFDDPYLTDAGIMSVR
jgi:uncharacterized protein